jgi:hypothetical protein
MSSTKTPFVRHPWVAMFVAVPDSLAAPCEKALTPLPVVRVANVGAALERLPALKPLLVVTGDIGTDQHLATLSERASNVGATVVSVHGLNEGERLLATLQEALVRAEKVRLSEP